MEETAPVMLSMPAELLHRVFEDLSPQDVLSTRRTCSTLAEVGKEYMLRSIVAIYKRDSFERLLAASDHPYFSQRIKTLHFQADKFDEKMTYRKWKQSVLENVSGQKQIKAMDAYMAQHADGPWGEDKVKALSDAMKHIAPISDNDLPDDQLKPAYKAYCHFLDDQEAMDEENLAVECLTKLFERCHELEEVTLRLGPGQATRYEMVKRAFKKGGETPYVDDSGSQGVDQWASLAGALIASKKALKSLTVCPASFNILNSVLPPTMIEIMSSLETFKLGIECFFDENGDEEEDDFFEVEEQARELFAEGELAYWLSAAKGLRTLKLRMPAFDFGESIWISMSHVIGNTKWDHLSELSISTVETSEDDLVHLLLRHKATLRRLYLSYIDLHAGNLGFSEFGEAVYQFTTSIAEGERINGFRDHIEDRLLNGGKVHLPHSDDDDEKAAYETMLKDGNDGKLYSEVPEYVSPRKEDVPAKEYDDDDESEDEFDRE